MKKQIGLSLALLLFIMPAFSQVLNVNKNIQEFDQWCWAGCSKTILDYYGINKQQCEIAEYTRTQAKFHNFGSINCCQSATNCNYWNYNYGYAGSIQDILIHFGGIQNTGIATSLTKTEIAQELQQNKLFVIRWGWSTSGGHFIVGHGINGDNIYFMNPWFGEGLHIGTYSFMLSGKDNTSTATHTWTHTNKITSNMFTDVNQVTSNDQLTVTPNPVIASAQINSGIELSDATISILDTKGMEVRKMEHISGQQIQINRDQLPGGIYFLRLSQDNQVLSLGKLIVSDY